MIGARKPTRKDLLRSRALRIYPLKGLPGIETEVLMRLGLLPSRGSYEQNKSASASRRRRRPASAEVPGFRYLTNCSFTQALSPQR